MGHIYSVTTATAGAKHSAFSQSVLSLLRQVEYRPMVTSEDIEALYRFRYDCYLRDGWIGPNSTKLSYDQLDDDPHVMRFGLFMNDQMVSSIRLQHLTLEKRLGASMVIYPDVVEPMLAAGKTMIDPSRLTIDANASRDYPALPYLTVRLATMLSEHFEVDYCLSSVRPSHGAFYRRLTGAKMIAGERYYDGMSFPIHLYASEIKACRESVLAKYPFFSSLPMERRMLFGSFGSATESPLTVLPTADFALAA